MRTAITLQHYCAIAKQAGFMPTSWFALNLSSNDRTPEIMSGFREGEKIPRV